MRNGQNNNNKRLRNRNNNHSHNSSNNNNNRRSQNPMTRVYESNGPDIKIRGTASHVAEKYLQLARDARSSGDPVAAENYYQHAEHYFRLIAAAQEQFRQSQPQPRDGESTVTDDMGEDEGENFSHFGAEPGFGPNHQPNPQPQPRQEQPREHNQQPREHSQQPREQYQPRESRPPQPAFQQQPREPREQPPADIGAALPSFITGPQSNAAPFEGGTAPAGQEPRGDRFPRRRRRPHAGPRPDVAPVPAGVDA
jgi:hypothetical protein